MIHRALAAVTDVLATTPHVMFCIKGVDGAYLAANQAFADRAGVAAPGDVVGNGEKSVGAHASAFGTALRPGAMLGLVVAVVVAVVGLARFDERLMLIGLLSGPIIFVLHAVIVAVNHWHVTNTEPGASYVDAEEMIKLEQVSLKRTNTRPRPESKASRKRRTTSR